MFQDSLATGAVAYVEKSIGLMMADGCHHVFLASKIDAEYLIVSLLKELLFMVSDTMMISNDG
ncbi:hypothetical protein EON65_27925 [archaeon]|nr:MAG: hypothetical protein EON65_27925 [archaeon]